MDSLYFFLLFETIVSTGTIIYCNFRANVIEHIDQVTDFKRVKISLHDVAIRRVWWKLEI